LKLSNYGQGTSSSLTASLQTDNPNVLDIDPDSITFSALEPGQSAWGNAQFFINFEELPSSTLGTFILEINDIYNRTWPITLVLTTEQLPPPDSLEFQPESQTSLRLSWAPVTLGSGEEIRYDVYRRPEGSGSFQKINTLPVANSTRFFDENLTGNQNYEYRVRAVDPSGRISGYISTLVGWGTVPLQSGFPQYANDYRIGLEGDAVAFDFNGGDKEIIAPGNNGQLIIYHSDGSVYHQFSGLEGNLMTPAFGNVDNDQNIEMLVPCYKNGADGNKIYIFDCATLNREYTLIHPNRYSVNNVALADINGNGKMEIFATGFGGNNPDDSVKTKSKLFAWEYGVFGDGTSGFSLYASRVFEETPYLLNPPAIHDLDNTGAPEIALGVKNDLLVLNSQTLQTLSSYTCGEGVISCQTSFGDLDNDGEYDLVFTTDGDSTIDNTLWVLKYSDIPDSYNL
ncbi:MAG: fibronectin type III domain-containing protein, partial [Gammaproteobacteria bacterium]|nr:fibronectin type III domain-containing protein [candidate division Zixibacteria bacterium]NIR94062.1 fibronectin type III domain-containing protein [Gammaproteobacteria bacterium]NIT59166.1 fibronectin type III domain-containing protein [Fodinibius sp.]NIS47349.1 fibronectin type III domain-containing protein [candidate division Zixibacteria bacterium]NIU15463.1 fibronectin type III domain-containing protein [candidate division Zixibacteria bacterium]